MGNAKFQSNLMNLQANLLNFAYMLTSNRDDAYDLLQDTTLKALDNEDKYAKKNKNHGLVVDYFGITKNLHKAVGIYNADDEQAAKEDLVEFETYFSAIEKEIPELEMRYNKIIQRFTDEGVSDIKDFLEQRTSKEREKEICEQIVAVAESIKFRSELDALLRLFFDIFDLLFNAPARYYP